jgi:hypothetical protein
MRAVTKTLPGRGPIERSYTDLAHLWPALSPVEHYAPEAAVLRHLLGERLPRSKSRVELLELGAGGGHVIHHMKDDYAIVAVDHSPQMLDNCRILNPEVDCAIGDMRTVRLDRQFDAVLIHDAIDYMTSAEDVGLTLGTISAHLGPGGLAFVAPTYVREDFTDGDTASDAVSTDELDVTYFSYVHDPNPSDTCFEMVLLYLLRDRSTRTLRVVEDRHTCGLFSIAEWLASFDRAGFDAELWTAPDEIDGFDPPTWSLFVATKR